MPKDSLILNPWESHRFNSIGNRFSHQPIDSGRERLNRSRSLFAAMPDRVNLSRIGDVRAGPGILHRTISGVSA
jgi:hypothetical protein